MYIARGSERKVQAIISAWRLCYSWLVGSMAVILPRTYNTYFITPHASRTGKNAVMNEWMHVYVQRFSVSFPA